MLDRLYCAREALDLTRTVAENEHELVDLHSHIVDV